MDTSMTDKERIKELKNKYETAARAYSDLLQNSIREIRNLRVEITNLTHAYKTRTDEMNVWAKLANCSTASFNLLDVVRKAKEALHMIENGDHIPGARCTHDLCFCPEKIAKSALALLQRFV